MAADQAGYRLYQDLAAWWPLISPPEEYAEEAAFAGRLLREADRPVRTVLELGSGGGHCASHLAPGFSMTLVDLSPGMLTVSRRLNPDCEHVEADMRTVRTGRSASRSSPPANAASSAYSSGGEISGHHAARSW